MKKMSCIAALVALVVSSNVFANEVSSEEAGWAVVVEAGVGHQKVDVSGGYETESGNSFAPSIAGAYNFNSNWSVVAQYTDYGETDLFTIPMYVLGQSVNVGVSAETTGASLVAQYMSGRMVDSWNYGVKLGLMSWDTKMFVKAQAGGNSARESFADDNGTAIYGGLLGSYALNENVDITVNADWFVSDVEGELVDGETTELLRGRYSLGVNYHF